MQTTNRRMRAALGAGWMLLALVLALPAVAAPRVVVQLRASDGTGTPLPDGPYRVTVTLYDGPGNADPGLDASNVLYTETHESADVQDGLVVLTIGPIDDTSAFGDPLSPVYAGIRFGTDSNQELRPRQQLVSAFHAFQADRVADGGISAPKLAPESVTTEKLAIGSITQDKLDPQVVQTVPVGGIVLWWGALVNMPPGFELADGREASQGTFYRNGQKKPDLRNRFPRGVDPETGDPGIATSVLAPTGNCDPAPGATEEEIRNAPDACNVNQGGVTDPHVLVEAEVPAHTHPHDLDAAEDVAPSGNYDLTRNDGNPTTTVVASEPGHRHFENDNNRLCDGNASGGDDDVPTTGKTGTFPCNSWQGGEHEHSTFTGIVLFEGLGEGHSHVIEDYDNRPAFQALYYIVRVL